MLNDDSIMKDDEIVGIRMADLRPVVKKGSEGSTCGDIEREQSPETTRGHDDERFNGDEHDKERGLEDQMDVRDNIH
jgi:hypothetical protein